jgi:phosphoribosylformimino-5-aminoimidazole carboxamide ribotide isomerase
MGCEVIPVIDLLGGKVVHARRGERHRYQPIVSCLSASAAPDSVLDALASAFDPRIVYVADLDALQGGMPQHETLARLAAAQPRRRFWIDVGVRRSADLQALVPLANAVPVLASESLAETTALTARSDAVLSLDFRGEDLVDPARVWERVTAWPMHVIAMTLARVGSDSGPDIARLAAVRAHLGAHGKRALLYAAGGVRGPGDLDALSAAGIAGVLVASALHDGRLTPDDVAARR